ncbi:uncharacterized protein [Amphiura filiformis]|uniref:uncharacterized protein n=1 Tax=Amphiura filiformis TaxID=82378 RepID=UPI003B216B4B
MRFIENNELREWVKDNLRKTIFQKAHALATQTGCEVLVKLQDVTDAAGCQYYATSTLQQAYKISNLRQPGEMAVSGETGMPMFPMVDRAIQIGDDSNTGFASSLASEGDGDDGGGGGQGELNGDGQNTPVPMQLSMSGNEQGTEQRTYSEQGSQPPTPSEQQQAAGMGLGMNIKSEPGSDLMDLIGLIPGSGSAMNIKQEPPGGEDKSSDGTVSYEDSDDIVDVTPAQQAAQMQMMFQQQQLQQQLQQQAATQAAAQRMAGPMGSPPTSPFGAASAQLQAFSSSVPTASQGSPSGASQRYPVPMAPKPYQCATCQKAFGSIQLLQKHTQTFHMRAQNVMGQKTRGRGRGSRGSRGGGQRQSWQSSPSQSPNRFAAPGQQLSPQQQQWLEQVAATSSPSQMPQIAQVQTLQSQGGSSPGASSPYGQHSPAPLSAPGAGPSRAPHKLEDS